MSHPSNMSWQMEHLETRQLLSASIGIAPLLDGADSAVFARATKTPKILGTWTGTITDTGKHETTAFSLQFTSQKHTGALAGNAHVSGIGNGDFTGTISGDSIKLKVTGIKGTTTTVIGTYTLGKRGAGISGTWSDSSGSGTFSLAFV